MTTYYELITETTDKKKSLFTRENFPIYSAHVALLHKLINDKSQTNRLETIVGTYNWLNDNFKTEHTKIQKLLKKNTNSNKLVILSQYKIFTGLMQEHIRTINNIFNELTSGVYTNSTPENTVTFILNERFEQLYVHIGHLLTVLNGVFKRDTDKSIVNESQPYTEFNSVSTSDVPTETTLSILIGALDNHTLDDKVLSTESNINAINNIPRILQEKIISLYKYVHCVKFMFGLELQLVNRIFVMYYNTDS